MDADGDYDLVTVRRGRGGVTTRERLKGRDISVKSQFAVRAGDFLISKRQIVHGACGLVPPELDGSIVSNEYAVLRGRPSIDLNFLNYLSHSIYFQQTCFHSAIGVHVEKMIFKLESWLSWDFDLPPVPEQRRIAEILSTWDRAIETVEGLIANARTRKQALMQGLIAGNRCHPGLSGRREILELGDVTEFRSGGTPSKHANANWGGEFPWVSAKDMKRHYIGTAELGLTEVGRRRANVAPRDAVLILVRGMTLLKDVPIAVTTRPVAFNQDIKALLPKKNVIAQYLSYNLVAQKQTILALVNTANHGTGRLDTVLLKSLSISLPPLEEQRRIVEIMSAADRGIEATEHLLASTRAERAALMQQLLTGKRRVKLDAAAA